MKICFAKVPYKKLIPVGQEKSALNTSPYWGWSLSLSLTDTDTQYSVGSNTGNGTEHRRKYLIQQYFLTKDIFIWTMWSL